MLHGALEAMVEETVVCTADSLGNTSGHWLTEDALRGILMVTNTSLYNGGDGTRWCNRLSRSCSNLRCIPGWWRGVFFHRWSHFCTQILFIIDSKSLTNFGLQSQICKTKCQSRSPGLCWPRSNDGNLQKKQEKYFKGKAVTLTVQSLIL